jgi:hypothetical protein
LLIDRFFEPVSGTVIAKRGLGGSFLAWRGMERTTMTVHEHRKNLLLLATAIIVGVILLAVGTAEAVCR